LEAGEKKMIEREYVLGFGKTPIVSGLGKAVAAPNDQLKAPLRPRRLIMPSDVRPKRVSISIVKESKTLWYHHDVPMNDQVSTLQGDVDALLMPHVEIGQQMEIEVEAEGKFLAAAVVGKVTMPREEIS